MSRGFQPYAEREELIVVPRESGYLAVAKYLGLFGDRDFHRMGIMRRLSAVAFREPTADMYAERAECVDLFRIGLADWDRQPVNQFRAWRVERQEAQTLIETERDRIIPIIDGKFYESDPVRRSVTTRNPLDAITQAIAARGTNLESEIDVMGNKLVIWVRGDATSLVDFQLHDLNTYDEAIWVVGDGIKAALDRREAARSKRKINITSVHRVAPPQPGTRRINLGD